MSVYLDGASSLWFLRKHRRAVSNPDLALGPMRPVLPSAWKPAPAGVIESSAKLDGSLLSRFLSNELHGIPTPIGLLVGNATHRTVAAESSEWASRATLPCRFSVCRQEFPRASFYKVAPGLFVCSPELALLRLGTRMSFAGLAQLCCELCGSYVLDPADEGGFLRSAPIASSESLQALCAQVNHVSGVQRARQVATYSLDGSASPRETELALLMSLPRTRGGYGLPRPALNQGIGRAAQGLRPGRRAPSRRFVPDILWPDGKIALEYNSDAWHTGARRIVRDSRKIASYVSRGITVIPVTNEQLRSIGDMDGIARTVARHLRAGTRTRDWTAKWRERQAALRREFGLPVDELP